MYRRVASFGLSTWLHYQKWWTLRDSDPLRCVPEGSTQRQTFLVERSDYHFCFRIDNSDKSPKVAEADRFDYQVNRSDRNWNSIRYISVSARLLAWPIIAYTSIKLAEDRVFETQAVLMPLPRLSKSVQPLASLSSMYNLTKFRPFFSMVLIGGNIRF